MLREILSVRQDNPLLRRRWYQDDFFDLYTWHEAGGRLTAFQLCYDVRRRQRVLAWKQGQGFSHARIDDGGGARPFAMSPVFAAAGRFPHRMVRERFRRNAAALDAGTRERILEHMREYGRALARGLAGGIVSRSRRRASGIDKPAAGA